MFFASGGVIRRDWRFGSRELVGTTGFEPATPCPPDKCATRLRHAPTEAAEYTRRLPGEQCQVRLKPELFQGRADRGKFVERLAQGSLLPFAHIVTAWGQTDSGFNG